MRRISLLAGLTLFAFAVLPMAAAPAQTVALSGQVTSAEEGAMEGVLVSAKKAGSTITITVVSDKDGRYSFPASKIEPGQYALRIRAIGYDLDNHKSIEVAAQKTTTLDLKLRKTEDLAAQLSNAEWINSIPGNDPRKGVFLNCVGCHTLERVMRSTHSADDFPEDHASADAELRQPEHPATPAASPRRAADGGARRFTRADLQGDGGLSRDRQSQLEAAVELPARPDAPAGRPRHARDLHRIRPAARHHRAPRRHRR